MAKWGFLLFSALLILIGVTSMPHVKNDDFNIGCLKCHPTDKSKLNVHLIPHSHDDVGWLKTLDQYYYGLNSTIQQASVQYIITSVVMSLLQNPDRRFIQVETAFFWKWWQEHESTELGKAFRSLVNNGQLEIVNGAWSMNDEACTNYQSTIDQFTWGLSIIADAIGECGTPRVGWQIDPFGHSREQASLLAQMGYDSMFFARLDQDDKRNRQKLKAMDFAWQGSANLENTTIFGSTFATSLYGPPDGFCWDILCSDDPIDNNPDSPDYNIDKKVEVFTKLVTEYKKYYPTNNLIIPMGSDFQFSAAESNFINMDRFIEAFKNNSDINVLYSTPSCYVKAVNDANPTLILKTDDFFPYSNDEHSFWAGYFTSRPNSKRFERVGHKILQTAKQLYSFAIQNSTEDRSGLHQNLRYLREAMGTLQHHDAVTGTEKQHVAKDYVRRLSQGIERAEESIGDVIRLLSHSEDLNSTLKLSSCLLSNISICSISQNSDKILTAVYNPLAWTINHFVRIPVERGSFQVSGPDGQEDYDLVPVLANFSFVNLTNERPSSHDLVFLAKNIPPLGYKLYYIEKINKTAPVTNNSDSNIFGWDKTYFTIDPDTNLLKSITLNNQTLNIEQNFYYYRSVTRDKDSDPKVVSGAYLFRPNGTSPVLLNGSVTRLLAFDGKLVKEFHQQWSDPVVDVLQSIRIYKDEGHVEFDWIVGNIEVGDNKTGKEIITRYSISDDFDNNNTFYTDSNGRETIKRVLNYRPDYTYNSTVEPVASNYYPVTSKIVIKDDKKNLRVAVLNDRSQGGSSLNKGEIELMVHRRLFQDDNKGVGEPLNETEFGRGIYVRGSHFLLFGDAKSIVAKERTLAQKKLLLPWVGLGEVTKDMNLTKIVNNSFSGLTKPLPDNVNVLTLEPWNNGTFILRLEHIFEKNEDSKLSSPVTISLEDIFANSKIKEINETTLAANILIAEFKAREKYSWQTNGTKTSTVKSAKDESNMTISLAPMQIRTFIITVGNKTGGNTNSGFVVQPVYYLICVIVITIFKV